MEINGRLVIPVQQQYQNSVGIVHDASRSGKTCCYVKPTEIVGLTNELCQVEAELRTEEALVWRQLTEMIVEHREEIERNVASLGHLDLAMARVKLGKRWQGVVLKVGEEGVVSFKEARHPILLLRELEGVVGSDVNIGRGKKQGLILTGPNSGEKTIILVSARVIICMSHSSNAHLFVFTRHNRNCSDSTPSCWCAMEYQSHPRPTSLPVLISSHCGSCRYR
jgi:DNA mismatch repair protein MutS2